MNEALQQKLKELPKTPGVYFHKDKTGEIIYVGKAAVLKNRVRQYFQSPKGRDPKTAALVAEITDTEWIETESEIDALFLEAEMVRRYMPRYNILLRDDKSLLYVRIDIKSDYPTVSFTRRPMDDKAEYFGPYLSGFAVRRALKLLRRIFPYSVTRAENTMNSRLYEQIGLDPGLETGKTSINEYRANLRKLMRYLRGERGQLLKEIEKDMKTAAKAKNFEAAAFYRNQLQSLKELNRQIVFGDREFLDITKDHGLAGLADLLGLELPPKRIEGFDISHMSGTDTVASMVVFMSGMPDKAAYRKFKMRLPGNDDFAHMHEVINRRLAPKHQKEWGLPDFFLIDGGKGQLTAALKARDEWEVVLPMVGLAKREEEIVVHKDSSCKINMKLAHDLNALVTEKGDFSVILLPKNSHIVKLLQRVRDESHRFAVSYHSTLKRKRQVASSLEEVPGIGPVTRKKLMKTFGSARGVAQARAWELEKVVGADKAILIRQYLR